MRLLFLVQGMTHHDQPGYHDGFQRVLARGLLTDYQQLCYPAMVKSLGYGRFCDRVIQKAHQMDAHVVFLQFPHGFRELNPDFFTGLRRALPGVIICSSNGDGFSPIIKPLPRSLVTAARYSDLTFTTSMGWISRQWIKQGARNIVLMPNGFCQVRFGKAAPSKSPEFDIAFVGSLYRSRNPLRRFHPFNRRRKTMVEQLTRRYGKKFGLFGHGWQGNPSWQGPLDYAAQEACYQNARMVFGGSPHNRDPFYHSDRFFIAAVSGSPLVDTFIPGLGHFLLPDTHWHPVSQKSELVPTLDRLLDMDEVQLKSMGQRTREFCLDHHSQYHRVHNMIEIIHTLKEARDAGVLPVMPPLRYFHPHIRPRDIQHLAVWSWSPLAPRPKASGGIRHAS